MPKILEIQSIKRLVKSLISKNEIKEALAQLQELVEFTNNVNNEFIVISSNFYNISRQEKLGILDVDIAARKKAEIANSLLEFIDDLRDSDLISILENSEIVKNLRLELEAKELEVQKKDDTISSLQSLITQKDREITNIILKFDKFRLENSNRGLSPLRKLTIEEVVKGGETKNVEFKLKIDILYYDVIVKNIVSFLNIDGGVIIFGVDDSGKVIGLKPMSAKEIDQIQNKLMQKLKEASGSIALGYINFEMIKYNDKIIMAIECTPSEEPIFCKRIVRGEEYEEFYIRRGTSNMRISSISSIFSYIKNRFFRINESS